MTGWLGSSIEAKLQCSAGVMKGGSGVEQADSLGFFQQQYSDPLIRRVVRGRVESSLQNIERSLMSVLTLRRTLNSEKMREVQERLLRSEKENEKLTRQLKESNKQNVTLKI